MTFPDSFTYGDWKTLHPLSEYRKRDTDDWWRHYGVLRARLIASGKRAFECSIPTVKQVEQHPSRTRNWYWLTCWESDQYLEYLAALGLSTPAEDRARDGMNRAAERMFYLEQFNDDRWVQHNL